MGKTPLLIISDHPSASTGLARITRDLTVRIHEHMSDTFRLGVLGYGGPGSRKFGFTQYHIEGMGSEWIIPNLPEVCEDFFGDERGIVLCIWDISRLGWFARPEMHDMSPHLKQFLLNPPFKKWIYAPIDASGPNDRLTFPLKEALKGFDRVLGYGKWAAGVLDRTMELPEGATQWLPHGINADIFYPRDRKYCRSFFPAITGAIDLFGNAAKPVANDETLVTIVATNQARKDFGIGIAAFKNFSYSHKARLWIKTDVIERNWSIPALLLDHEISDKTMISLGDLSDESLAQAYSASDLVLGIAPEGFGFVHVESTACGCPCIVGSYAGGAELVPKEMHVNPRGFRYEGVWTFTRPVYHAWDWTYAMERWLGKRTSLHKGDDPFSHYDWNVLWDYWYQWLKEGAE